MVIATLRPSREPSESRSLKIVFRTGACWATQSILRCPSGARAGSLTIDSSIMLLLLRVTVVGSYLQVYRAGRRDAAPLPAGPVLFEQARQHPRSVGHDDVHPEIQQPTHLAGVVYGPHVHPRSPGVGGPHEARRDQLDPLVLDGHLERVVGGARQRLEVRPAQEVERRYLAPR